MHGLQEERREPLKEAVAELREGPRELVDLYNDYVCPWARWGLALEMVEVANYSDAAYVRQLWDVYLRQVPCLPSFLIFPCHPHPQARLSVLTHYHGF